MVLIREHELPELLEVNCQLRSHRHHQQIPVQVIPWVPILNPLAELDVGVVDADQRILGGISVGIELIRYEEVREDAIEKDRENLTDYHARALDDLFPYLNKVNTIGEGTLLLPLEGSDSREDALLEQGEKQPVHGSVEYSVHSISSV